MSDNAALESELLTAARVCDADRSLAAMLAPAEHRPVVLALILLRHELRRIPEVTTQSMAALIRYQWWRDALAQLAQDRPAATPLLRALAPATRDGRIDAAELEALVDAHEAELELHGFADLARLEDHLAATAGRLGALWLAAIGGDAELAPAVRRANVAASLVGIAVQTATDLQRGHLLLPADLLQQEGGGLTCGDEPAQPFGVDRNNERLQAASGAVLDRADRLIAAVRSEIGRMPRAWLSPFLPMRIAEGRARVIRAAGGDPSRARAALPAATVPRLLWAWLRRAP